MAFDEIKRFRYLSEFQRELKDNPIICKKLGFNRKPAYSTICHLLNMRLGSDGKRTLKNTHREHKSKWNSIWQFLQHGFHAFPPL